jgi:hypothetical protein
MFGGRDKPIRIISGPENQCPDKWSYTVQPILRLLAHRGRCIGCLLPDTDAGLTDTDAGLPDTDAGPPDINCGKRSDRTESSFSNEPHVRVQLKCDGTW